MISVIIPCYNQEKYIEKTLKSLLEYPSIFSQIIVVDDGSKDKSKDIILNLTNDHEIIDYLHQKNSGVSKARNTGLKHAKNDYILFLDADDYIEIYDFEKINLILSEKTKYDAILFDFTSDNNQITENKNEILRTIHNGYYLLNEILNDKLWIWIGSIVFNKNIIQDLNFSLDDYYGEDIEFIWKSLLKSKKVLNTGINLSHYRIHSNSSSRSFNLNHLNVIHSILNVANLVDDLEVKKKLKIMSFRFFLNELRTLFLSKNILKNKKIRVKVRIEIRKIILNLLKRKIFWSFKIKYIVFVLLVFIIPIRIIRWI